MSDEQDGNRVTVLCAWCGALLQEGGESISHGICKDCAPTLLEKIRERLKDSGGHEPPQRDTRVGRKGPARH